MEDTSESYLKEEYFFDSLVLKRTLSPGTCDQLTQNSKVTLNEYIYSDSSKEKLSESLNKIHKIILYPEGATISPYDTLLLSMHVGEESLIRFPYTHHSLKHCEWDTVWYKIKILSIDRTAELLSLPQHLPFLREHRLGPAKLLTKRIRHEGHGLCATITSRVTYNYEIFLENGCVIESATSKPYQLTRGCSPGMHLGVHLALFTMRCKEEALIYLPPGFHVCDKFLETPVWASVYVGFIDFSTNLVFPQHLAFEREVELREGASVLKRVVKEGEGPEMRDMNKIWVLVEGRCEDGYQFQKPKEEVMNFMGAKIFSEAVVLGISSMKRGEVAWVRAAPETHLYKEGYQNETLWFKFCIKEYLEPFEKIMPAMAMGEKLKASREALEIAKRLYASGTKKECKVFYNDIITALKLKKGGYSELSEEVKAAYVDVRGRAMMNLALMLIKEVEESEKEDFKIKTLQKVLEMCEELLSYDNNNIKGLYRKGNAYFLKKMFPESLETFKKILSIQPQNKESAAFIKKIKQETSKTERKEKKMYQGIFLGSHWADESEREVEQQSLKQLEQARTEEESKRKEESDLQQRQLFLADTIKRLESGAVIDFNDATDPLTDAISLHTDESIL